jgi:hypothetical protein
MNKTTQVEQLISQMEGIMICMNETLKIHSTYKQTEPAYYALKTLYHKLDSIHSELYNAAHGILNQEKICLELDKK